MQTQSLREIRRAELISDIAKAKANMDIANQNFNCVYTPDEVDICIYQLREAEARYNSLIKKLKNL